MFANHLTLLFELDHILVLDLSAKQKKYKSYFLVKEIKDCVKFQKEINNIYLCNCQKKIYTCKKKNYINNYFKLICPVTTLT